MLYFICKSVSVSCVSAGLLVILSRSSLGLECDIISNPVFASQQMLHNHRCEIGPGCNPKPGGFNQEIYTPDRICYGKFLFFGSLLEGFVAPFIVSLLSLWSR